MNLNMILCTVELLQKENLQIKLVQFKLQQQKN